MLYSTYINIVRGPHTPLLFALGLLLFLMASSCSDDGSSITGKNKPELSAPRTINFSQVILGEHEEKLLVVKNVGSTTLHIHRFELIADSSELTLSNAPSVPVELAPEGEFSVTVNYDPRDEVRNSGEIVIESNDPDNDVVIIEITTLNIQPRLSVDPVKVDFGRVRQGESDQKQGRIRNIGQSPLIISSISLSGSPDFEFILPETEYTLPNGSFELPVYRLDEEIIFFVNYRPQAPGSDQGELIILSNDPNQETYRLEVEANGTSPCLLVSSSQVDFGEVRIGDVGEEVITLTNCGSAPLIIHNIEHSEGDRPPQDYQFLIQDSLSEVSVEPEQSVIFTLLYAPTREESHGGKFTIINNDEAQQEFEVQVFGRGVINQCPVAIINGTILGQLFSGTELEAVPLDLLVLDGISSVDPDGQIVEYLWEVTERPEGSTSVFAPVEGETPDLGRRQLFLDLANTYRVSLNVIDDQGLSSSNEMCGGSAELIVLVIPDEAIHVQLVWYNPDDPSIDDFGADVDLHMMKMNGLWFNSAFDCYFSNKMPIWGEELPSLDIDDVNEAGPENINLDNPGDCSWYAVAIHYWEDSGMGSAYVTGRIYINGMMVFEALNQALANSGSSTGDWWDMARIHWPSGQIVEVNEITQGDVPREEFAPITDGMIESGLCGVDELVMEIED